MLCPFPWTRTPHRSAPRPASRQRSQKQAISLRACPPPTSQVRHSRFRRACTPCANRHAPHTQHYARLNPSLRHIITAWRIIARPTSTNEGSSSARSYVQASEPQSASPLCIVSVRADGEADERLLRLQRLRELLVPRRQCSRRHRPYRSRQGRKSVSYRFLSLADRASIASLPRVPWF